eukprot:TRINITY_DN28550_c0_g1_i1.p2 TRINITY_DN28550_c0_g1~~TRINITY_DN28550_c0_g1_i1.p2  ORF type:complete len:114 (-),score=9.78 TRINITY_DN28550_c0_g1_i1:69-410(-)
MHATPLLRSPLGWFRFLLLLASAASPTPPLPPPPPVAWSPPCAPFPCKAPPDLHSSAVGLQDMHHKQHLWNMLDIAPDCSACMLSNPLLCILDRATAPVCAPLRPPDAPYEVQ